MKTSLIIPCFNESENLPLLLDNIKNLDNYKSLEIIIVDNGSTDNSLSLIKNFHNKNSNFRFISLDKNIGYGHGILQGLKIAKGELLAWTHADLQTDVFDILEGIKLFENTEEKVFVKGLRYGRRITDRFFTICMSLITSFKLGYFFWDINAQPSIFPCKFFKEWKNPPYDFSLDLYAYFQAKKLGYKVKRFPVIFRKRLFGESKWNFNLGSKIKFIRRALAFIDELSKKY